MIEGIGSGPGGVPAQPRATEPSPQGVAAVSAVRAPGSRRERRLRWLASVRDALDEASPLVDEMAAATQSGEEAAAMRASIADALAAVDEISGRMGGHMSSGVGDALPVVTDLAHRIAATAPLSLEVQARLGPGAVRRLVEGTR